MKNNKIYDGVRALHEENSRELCIKIYRLIKIE